VLDGATPDASVHALRAGELASIWDEVGRMPPAQREAFLLREIRGLSYGQLAAELSLSPSSVRSLLLRARLRLRHRLRDVAAGLGGAPWVQAVVRLVTGGEGTSAVPAATKAAAVGIGALALVGGADPARVTHQHPSTHGRPGVSHPATAHAGHAPTPGTAAGASAEDRPGRDVRRSDFQRSGRRDDDSPQSGSGRSGSPDGSANPVTSSGDGSEDGTAIAQPADGGDNRSNTTATTSGKDGSTDGSSDGGNSGRSASDGGSDSTTTTTSSGSDGGDSSSGGSDGPDG
jgi:Sigma-70, region 4